MTETRELICINCPLGCGLTVTMKDGEVVKVEGNTCPKGEAYGKKEVTNPTRIVTSTVRVSGGLMPVVSVKTASAPRCTIYGTPLNFVVCRLNHILLSFPSSRGTIV